MTKADSGDRFYGWFLVGILWVIYGLGISPAFYSWGILLRESSGMGESLALSAAQAGLVFSVFQYLYHFVGPLVGPLAARFTLRWLMTAGSLIAAAGFFMMSRAETFTTALVAFGLLGGAGIGLSMFIPCQTLPSNWFRKYRARAMAIILTAGGLVGTAVHWLDELLLASTDWRSVWVVIASISVLVAVLCALFVRDRPEDLGQSIDGAPVIAGLSDPGAASRCGWTAALAVRTPQFALIMMASIAFGLPWGSMTVFLPRLLESGGFLPAVATGILSARVFISTAGRFLASAGDFMPPQRVLGAALLIEALGTAGFLVADSQVIAYLSAGFLGLGFGTAYVSVSVTFAAFFGREPFAGIRGVADVVRGIVTPSVPAIFGFVVDRTQSYQVAVIGVAILTAVGGLAALICRHPGAGPVGTEQSAADARGAIAG